MCICACVRVRKEGRGEGRGGGAITYRHGLLPFQHELRRRDKAAPDQAKPQRMDNASHVLATVGPAGLSGVEWCVRVRVRRSGEGGGVRIVACCDTPCVQLWVPFHLVRVDLSVAQ